MNYKYIYLLVTYSFECAYQLRVIYKNTLTEYWPGKPYSKTQWPQ